MKILINMSEKTYKHILSTQFFIPGLGRSGKSLIEEILKAIRMGTPLSEGSEHYGMWGGACEDAISRKEVIKLLEKEDWVDTVTGVLALPFVKPKAKWIPVSEGLPEDGQDVLICDIDGDIMVGHHVYGRPNTHFSQDGTYDYIKNVKAWMPLPDAYEPQESEEE